MAQPSTQTSFASGEWAPKLRSRVDIAKYHAGAALLRNFFVDFSGGGASTRQGTKYINQCAALGSRLIPFQPGSNLSYVLEFGQNYIRFYSNGATVLSGGVPYQISSPYNASDLFPNQATGNPGLKFVQDVTSLIICHPNYAPTILTVISANNWTLATINFGPTIATPATTSISATTSLDGGDWQYAYVVTAVDANNQESAPTTPQTATGLQNTTTTLGSITFSWAATLGAISYNVYKASPVYGTTISTGTQFGLVSNVTTTSFIDTSGGPPPDFSQTPPTPQNPFVGAGVQSATVTNGGAYGPSVSVIPTFDAPSSGARATGYATLSINSATVSDAGSGYAIDDFIYLPGNIVLQVLTLTGFSSVNTVAIIAAGASQTTTFSNPQGQIATSGSGKNVTFNLGWFVSAIGIYSSGAGYTSIPAITFSSGAAAATAVLGTVSSGNPGVPAFFQERLMLAGQLQAIQSYNLSQPGSFFNYNISNPSEDDDAISGSIISDQLNDIRWARPVPTGIILGTGKTAWLINGGGGLSTAVPITPSNQTAQPQAFNGANDLQPQQINYDMIYGTNKGSYFRDLTYNIYANIYTGTDISVLSNHLFFGYNFLDIAWSEEPFKTIWIIRNDGVMLSLAFVKDQELIGWAHHDTNGQFMSVCSVIETINGNVVDAVYVIAQRVVNGTTVQYVERMADRYFPYGYEDSWSVDCGLQTAPEASPAGMLTITGAANTVGNSVTLTDTVDAPFTNTMATNRWIVRAGGGIYEITGYTSTSIVTATVSRVPSLINAYSGIATLVIGFTIWKPVTTVSGLTQLEGQSVVGVADGAPIGPLTVSNTGTVVLPNAATKVTLGLKYLPQLKTLPLDLGEPTAQSKRKKLPALSLRVADTLGLQVGTSFANAVTVKDLQIGAIPSNSTGPGQQVTDLVNPSWGDLVNPDYQPIDARQILDQLWQEPGQVCIQQNLPYPATILGVMPEVTLGDTPR